jgi:hypothetical protein
MSYAFAVTTGDDGKAAMTGLPVGTTAVLDHNDDRYASIEADGRVKLTGASASSTINLKPGATFSGRLTQNGKGVAGIKVGAQTYHPATGSIPQEYWGETLTDADGYYRMTRLNAGAYTVAFDMPPHDLGGAAPAHENVTARAGQSVSGLDFVLTPGALIEGHISKPDGSNAPGIYVGVYGPAHPRTSAWVQACMTAKDGSYKLRVPAGEQYVYIMLESQASKTVTVKEGSTTKIDLTLH